jgi:hypothetical protein
LLLAAGMCIIIERDAARRLNKKKKKQRVSWGNGYLDATRLRLLCVLYALFSSRSVSERVDKYLYQLADIILLDCGLCLCIPRAKSERRARRGAPL